MKSFLLASFVLVGLFLATPIFAGKGHKHAADGSHLPLNDLSDKDATAKAQKEISRLVESGKLDKSWEQAMLGSSEKKTINGKSEWQLTFKNREEKESSKQMLYIFLTPKGGFIAANFTGK